jgi:hypothetical protein
VCVCDQGSAAPFKPKNQEAHQPHSGGFTPPTPFVDTLAASCVRRHCQSPTHTFRHMGQRYPSALVAASREISLSTHSGCTHPLHPPTPSPERGQQGHHRHLTTRQARAKGASRDGDGDGLGGGGAEVGAEGWQRERGLGTARGSKGQPTHLSTPHKPPCLAGGTDRTAPGPRRCASGRPRRCPVAAQCAPPGSWRFPPPPSSSGPLPPQPPWRRPATRQGGGHRRGGRDGVRSLG